MTIKKFHKGLALRPFDADINTAYANKYENIDFSRYSLIPVRKPQEVSIKVDKCDSNDTNSSFTNTELKVKDSNISYNIKVDNREETKEVTEYEKPTLLPCNGNTSSVLAVGSKAVDDEDFNDYFIRYSLVGYNPYTNTYTQIKDFLYMGSDDKQYEPTYIAIPKSLLDDGYITFFVYKSGGALNYKVVGDNTFTNLYYRSLGFDFDKGILQFQLNESTTTLAPATNNKQFVLKVFRADVDCNGRGTFSLYKSEKYDLIDTKHKDIVVFDGRDCSDKAFKVAINGSNNGLPEVINYADTCRTDDEVNNLLSKVTGEFTCEQCTDYTGSKTEDVNSLVLIDRETRTRLVMIPVRVQIQGLVDLDTTMSDISVTLDHYEANNYYEDRGFLMHCNYKNWFLGDNNRGVNLQPADAPEYHRPYPDVSEYKVATQDDIDNPKGGDLVTTTKTITYEWKTFNDIPFIYLFKANYDQANLLSKINISNLPVNELRPYTLTKNNIDINKLKLFIETYKPNVYIPYSRDKDTLEPYKENLHLTTSDNSFKINSQNYIVDNLDIKVEVNPDRTLANYNTFDDECYLHTPLFNSDDVTITPTNQVDDFIIGVFAKVDNNVLKYDITTVYILPYPCEISGVDLTDIYFVKLDNINTNKVNSEIVNNKLNISNDDIELNNLKCKDSIIVKVKQKDPIDYTLKWTNHPQYFDTPLPRRQQYSLYYSWYNPTLDKETDISNGLKLAGREYGSTNDHKTINFNIKVFYQFEEQLYNAGFTQLKLYLVDENVPVSGYTDNYKQNTNPALAPAKIVNDNNGQLVEVDYYPVDQSGQITIDYIRYSRNQALKLDSLCVTTSSLSFTDWMKFECTCRDYGEGFVPKDHLLFTYIEYFGDFNGNHTEAHFNFSVYADSINRLKAWTEGLSDVPREIYIFKDGAYRLVWRGIGNMPKRLTLQDYNTILPLCNEKTGTITFDVAPDDEIPPKIDCDLVPADSLTKKWYYSHNLKKVVPLDNNDYALDYQQWLLIFGKERNLMRRRDKDYYISMDLPKLKITNATGGTGNDTVKIRVAPYHTDVGIEGVASDAYEITAQANDDITLTLEDVQDATFNAVRIYVLYGDLINYTLVEDKSFNTTITFTLPSVDDLVGNDIILGVDKQAPLKGMRYPITIYGVVVAAKDNKVYWSDVGNPHLWRREDYIEFNDEVTGLAKTNRGIVVFTHSETYLIIGTSPQTFALYLLDAEVGCINGDTIAVYSGGVAFVGYHGIYWTNGGKVDNLTANTLGKLYLDDKTLYATSANKTYALLLNDDDIFEQDDYYEVENKSIILELSTLYEPNIRTNDEKAIFIGTIKDELFITGYDRKLYKLYPRDTEYKVMHYKSGKLPIARFTEDKYFKDIYIAYEGDIHIKVTLFTKTKEVVILDKQLPADRKHFNAKMKHNYEGYAVDIEIIGTGKVHEIDFRAVGRENGK